MADLFAKQDGAAIAKGREVAELVAGVRLRDKPPIRRAGNCRRKSRHLRDLRAPPRVESER
jgi:hypothetical protein